LSKVKVFKALDKIGRFGAENYWAKFPILLAMGSLNAISLAIFSSIKLYLSCSTVYKLTFFFFFFTDFSNAFQVFGFPHHGVRGAGRLGLGKMASR
jgi:hypothetical protein